MSQQANQPPAQQQQPTSITALQQRQLRGAEAEAALRRCSVALHNAGVCMRQAQEALARYQWRNELMQEVLPGSGGGALGPPDGEEMVKAQALTGGLQHRHVPLPAGSTFGQQLLQAAAERFGGMSALREAATAPDSPGEQPAMSAVAAAHALASQRRQQLADCLADGLAPQPTRVTSDTEAL